MKKIKAFIYVYVKSLTNFPYYRDVIKTSFGFSAKYFLFLALIVALITSIRTSITFIPEMTKKLSSVMESAKSMYPKDLAFTIKNGEWSVNRPEPFIVALPQTDDSKQSSETPKNLVVFYNGGTIDDLKNLDTMILINKVNIIYRDSGGFRVLPNNNLPDSRFDRNDFDKVVGSFGSVVRVLPALFVLGSFGFILFGLITARIIYFAMFGLLVWLISKITGNNIGYKNSVKIAIHSATLPTTIGLLMTIIGVTIPVPSWFLLINAVFATLVLMNMNKAEKVENQVKPE